MERSQLLCYFENVLLLEAAIEAYNSTLNVIDDEKKLLGLPVQIVREQISNPDIQPHWLKWCAALGIGVFLALCFNIFIHAVWIRMIYGLALLFLIVKTASLLLKNHNAKKALRRADSIYTKACEKEQARLHDEKKRLGELRMVERQVSQQQKQLENELEKLYSMNVLYPGFRSPVPVAYFYKAIAGGITDKLEGPGGAYELYLQEEKAGRITGSPEEIERQLAAVSTPAPSISLLDEIRSHTFYDKSGAADGCVASLTQEVIRITKSQITASDYLDGVSKILEGILPTVDMTAIHSHVRTLNDYRVSIQQGVEAYYLKYPV